MEDRYLTKAKRLDNGEWVTGNLIQSSDAEDGWEAIIIPVKNSNMFAKYIENDYSTMFTKPIGRGYGKLGFENWYRVDPSTICQCTGLKDKNGKLIWENDIVKCKYGTAIVEWDRAEWKIRWIEESIWRRDLRHWSIDDAEGIEVIGNIFDNKDLLESEE